MPEDSRVPIIIGRPFLATTRAMIDVFIKKIMLRVGDDEVIFDVDQSIKKPPIKNDKCYGIHDLENTINAEAQELLGNDEPDLFLSRGLEKSIDQSDLEESKPVKLVREHLYSASANEIVEKKPELEDLSNHLEYAYLDGDKSFPIIISSKLSDKEKSSLLQVLEKLKGAIAWKMSNIKGIGPSYCTHKILMEDNFKPVIQPQRHLKSKVQDAVKNEIVKLLDFVLIYPISNSSWSYDGFFQTPITPEDQEKTTFTCPYGTFAYRRMPFGLCNAPATFQICMTAIFLRHGRRFYGSIHGRLLGVRDFAVGAVLGQRIEGKFKPIYYASKILNNAQEHYTTIEKELLAVVFSFDKFHPYLVLSKTIVYTDHSALKYLFSKQDAKPRLIRWVMLLQGLDIEIKDKRGAENLVADHLSRLKNPELSTFTKEEIVDEFPDEHLMALKTKITNDESWYADYVNHLIGKILCPDNIMRRCVAGNEISKILAHCHSGPTGGHHSALVTRGKVYESGFFWTSIFKDSKDYVMRCDVCQRSGNISSRSEMPQNNIQSCLQNTHMMHTFRLIYGKACHLPVEIEHKSYWALKQCIMDLTAAAKNRFMELNELIELRDNAYENTQIYKERIKKWHDSRLRGDKDFKVGDLVLLFNSTFKMHPGKLKSRWYSPNVVKTVYPYGTVEITNKNRISFKVNGQRLKKYHDRHIDTEDKEVMEFEEDTR
nr:hypothetical protein [Tanacetum cinerariifolium]